MAPKNRNRNRNKGANKPVQAPATVQQPMPSYNQSMQDARYITNLNPVGSPEFNRWNEKLGGNYDGGGWVTWNKNKGPGDSGMLASDDDMRAFARANAYREMNNIGLMNRGSVESDAAKFQAPSQGTTGGGTSPASANVGAGRRISRGRIQSIMDQKGIKGRDQDRARLRITNRLAQKGGTLGIGAAKDYAKAYAARNPQEAMMQAMTGQQMRVGSSGMTRTIGSPANDMSSRKGQKGALFRGIQGILDSKDYAKGDVLASLRSGDVRAQPFGTGAGGMGAGGGRNKKRNKNKRGGDTTMGADTGTTAMDQIQPMDMEPMAPEQMAEESSININMPTVADLIGNWASGFKTKRSSRKRAGSKAQGLSSQTVAPTGNWRYGT